MLDQIGTILRHVDELEAKAYLNNDLGMTYNKDIYTFKVWSPSADEVNLILYKTGNIEDDTFIKKNEDVTRR